MNKNQELEELNSQIAALESQKKTLVEQQSKLVNQLKQERADQLLANIDSILTLLPKHDRTSCSDKDPNNANHTRVRCSRCYALYAKDSGYWDADISLEISIRGPNH